MPLKNVCDNHGLHQLVREPTRDEYLLDFVLTDVDGSRSMVEHAIADHKATYTLMKIPVPASKAFVRSVWHFKGAHWDNLRNHSKHCLNVHQIPNAPASPRVPTHPE